MAEFCPDCWDRLTGTKDSRKRYMISKDLDLCEGCGEMKPVIVLPKRRYMVTEWFWDFFEETESKP